METEVDFGSWTLVETVAWAKKAFGDDVSASFEEEGVDGETLELLVKCGTIEQYKACGLKQQIYATQKTPSGSVTKSKAADSTRSVPKDDLTADTTGSITKGPVSDSTVHASAPTGPASDSTTLIDSGTTGTKSVTKDLPAKEIRSVTMNQATDSTDRESVTTGSIIHVTSNSTESVPKDIASDAIATKCNKDQTGTGPVTKELVADTAALEILSVTSPEDLDQQQEDDIIAKKIVVLSEGATLQNVKRQDVKVNGTLKECRVECIGNQDGMQGGMHRKPGWNALETRKECIGNQDGMYWKPGWNAMETRKECIGNQDGMHWKPGRNALETRKECIGNQDGMQWKTGRNQCIGNQDAMHWKPSETRMECIPNRALSLINNYADALHWIMTSNCGAQLLHYLDDFFLVGPPGKDTCQEAMYRVLLCSTHQHSTFAWTPDKLEQLTGLGYPRTRPPSEADSPSSSPMPRAPWALALTSMVWLELFTIMAVAKHTRSPWTGLRIHFHCDNLPISRPGQDTVAPSTRTTPLVPGFLPVLPGTKETVTLFAAHLSLSLHSKTIRGAHSPKAHTTATDPGNAGSDAEEAGRASLKQHDCLMLRAALTLGFFSFLWDGKFTMKNRSFNPRFHPTMQDSSWSREGVCYLKSSRKLTKWAEMPHFYWVYIPKYVSSGSNGGLYGMLQLFSHSTPLFHYRDGMPLTAKVLPLGFSTPDRAMWLQCSQIQYTQLFLHTSPLKKDDVWYGDTMYSVCKHKGPIQLDTENQYTGTKFTYKGPTGHEVPVYTKDQPYGNAESLKVPPLLARPFSDDAASKNEDTVDLRVLYFLIGVEKHNDDSKRNYFSSNRWDAPAEIMLAEHRLELLQQYAREKRHYTKHAAAYWHEGGMQKTRSQMRETNFAAIDV
eukprot:Em0062g7a